MPRAAARMTGCLLSLLAGGCGDVMPARPATLFSVPLAIDGQPVGTAILDTGGDYEILLREPFGLAIVDQVDVRVFAGTESVAYTEAFTYLVGGIQAQTPGAIVGVSSCDCNGLGTHFFRKTGVVLGLSFTERAAAFTFNVPNEGQFLRFAAPPEHLADFDTSYIEVEVAANGTSQRTIALLDTGATWTVMRRGLVTTSDPPWHRLPRVSIANPTLGTVSAGVGVFDTEGLPDLIIGTDVMQAWGDRWYFSFAPEGGTITVLPAEDLTAPESPEK